MKTTTAVKRLVIVISALTASANASPKPRINITVVRVDVIEVQRAAYTPARQGQTNTNCTGSATATGGGGYGSASGSSNCNTTSTPGSAAQVATVTVPESLVRIIFPDGTPNGHHVTLVCRPGFFVGGALKGGPTAERCHIPDAGAYEVEVSGNNVTVFSHNLAGKEQKDTFTNAGTW